jgi:hypothetical protein
MPQWLLLLSVLVATLLHGSAAAESAEAAAQLYAAVSNKQQRVQLGPGSTAALNDGPLDITEPLAVLGTANRPATIRCSRNGPHAFVVRYVAMPDSAHSQLSFIGAATSLDSIQSTS